MTYAIDHMAAKEAARLRHESRKSKGKAARKAAAQFRRLAKFQSEQ